MDKTIDKHPLQGIQTLCRYGFDNDSLETSRAALKVLANVLLLDSDARQIYVDLGYASKAAERMKVKHSKQMNPSPRPYSVQNDNREDELLTSRVLFLSTYDTKLDFDDLFNNHQLAESMNQVRIKVLHFSKNNNLPGPEHYSPFRKLLKKQYPDRPHPNTNASTVRNYEVTLQPNQILSPTSSKTLRLPPQHSKNPVSHPPSLSRPPTTCHLPNQLPLKFRLPSLYPPPIHPKLRLPPLQPKH